MLFTWFNKEVDELIIYKTNIFSFDFQNQWEFEFYPIIFLYLFKYINSKFY